MSETEAPVVSSNDKSLNEDPSSDVDFLSVAAAFAALVCCSITLAWCCVRSKNHEAIRRQAQARESSSTNVSAKERKEHRYQTVEQWLVSKKAFDHDVFCEIVITKSKNASIASDDSMEEGCGPAFTGENDYKDTQECPICMEVLSKDEVVSWSPNPTCNHVFHHQCIKEWLLKRTDCPFCRESFLPIDAGATVKVTEEADVLSADQLANLRSRHNEISRSCYYCIRHGIVCTNYSSDMDDDVREALQDRASQVVMGQELSEIRGKFKVLSESHPDLNLSIPAGSDASDTDAESQLSQAETSDEEA